MKRWLHFSKYLLYLFPLEILLLTTDYKYRARQVYLIFLFTITLAVMNITKMAYHEARPFWENSTLFAGDCSSEYGNPSGHSMTSAVFAIAMILEAAEAVKGTIVLRVGLGVLTGLVMTAYFILLGWSRMILGVHSINQVLYGWILGIWLALACHFCLRDSIIARA